MISHSVNEVALLSDLRLNCLQITLNQTYNKYLKLNGGFKNCMITPKWALVIFVKGKPFNPKPLTFACKVNSIQVL
jgi:hypothetical protein